MYCLVPWQARKGCKCMSEEVFRVSLNVGFSSAKIAPWRAGLSRMQQHRHHPLRFQTALTAARLARPRWRPAHYYAPFDMRPMSKEYICVGKAADARSIRDRTWPSTVKEHGLLQVRSCTFFFYLHFLTVLLSVSFTW